MTTDEKKKDQRIKYLKRRLRNGRTITRVDAELLRSLSHEVKESQIAGLVEPTVEMKPATEVGPESPATTDPGEPPPAPPPLGSPEPAPLPPPVVLPGMLSADATPLSPRDVAEMLTNMQKGIAHSTAKEGLMALPDQFWDSLWRPACESLIKQYAPNIGAQAAAPVVLAASAFNFTQALRAQARKKKLLHSPAMVAAGEPGTGQRDEPSETPENGAMSPPADMRDELFRDKQ